MKTKKKLKIVVFAFLILAFVHPALAISEYRPYLHNPEVPEGPGLNLHGAYQTALWPGAATYNFELETPPGRNALQPVIGLSYNSHLTNKRPGIVGTAWTLNENHIIRDVDYSFADSNDDKFRLVLNGQSHELVYAPSDGRFHTKIESFLHITKISGGRNSEGEYWIVKAKDGTIFRFGYNENSELVSNIHDYVTKWSLDLIKDMHGNEIVYSYAENPNQNDVGTVYPSKIEYNNEKSRVVEFVLEASDRPDRWLVYEQGNKIREARRIKEIVVKANNNLVRRHVLDYTSIGAKSFLSSVTIFGSDGSSLPPTMFEYNGVSKGWSEDSRYSIPAEIEYRLKKDNGLRLLDLNRDGLVDLTFDNEKSWINTGKGWSRTDAFVAPHNIVDANQLDTGMRYGDFNGDGLTDITRADGPADSDKDAWINTGNGWSYTAAWFVPLAAHPINAEDDNYDRGKRFIDFNGDGRTDILGNVGEFQTAWINTGSGWAEDGVWTPPADAKFVDSLNNQEDEGVRIADVNGDGLPDLLHGEGGTRETWLNTGSGWTMDNTYAVPFEAQFVDSRNGDDEGIRLADVNGDGLIDILSGKGSQQKRAWINTGAGWTEDSGWSIPELAQFIESDGDNKGVRMADVNGDGLPDILKTSPERKAWINKASKNYLLKGGQSSTTLNQPSWITLETMNCLILDSTYG
jgi:hypothetical protein